MEPNAVTSDHSPFHLFKVEQYALNTFVADKLKKGCIKSSDSPWVSNIFGIPDRDFNTGEAYYVPSGYALTMHFYLFFGSLINLTPFAKQNQRYHLLASTKALNRCVVVSSIQFWIWPKAMIKCGLHPKATSIIPPFTGGWSRLMRILCAIKIHCYLSRRHLCVHQYFV